MSIPSEPYNDFLLRPTASRTSSRRARVPTEDAEDVPIGVRAAYDADEVVAPYSNRSRGALDKFTECVTFEPPPRSGSGLSP